jgi:hypothetical protein
MKINALSLVVRWHMRIWEILRTGNNSLGTSRQYHRNNISADGRYGITDITVTLM